MSGEVLPKGTVAGHSSKKSDENLHNLILEELPNYVVVGSLSGGIRNEQHRNIETWHRTSKMKRIQSYEFHSTIKQLKIAHPLLAILRA